MKLTITCQTCGKTLSVVEKDQISDSDIAMYEAASNCDTVQSTYTDDDGNLVTVYDSNSNIQATKTVN